jgi:hypothetical protein
MLPWEKIFWRGLIYPVGRNRNPQPFLEKSPKNWLPNLLLKFPMKPLKKIGPINL